MMTKKLMVALLTASVFVLAAPAADAGPFGGLGRGAGKMLKGPGKLLKDNPALAGALVGGIVGLKLADGNLLGAVAGALITHEIVKSLSKNDRVRVARSTQTAAATGKSSEWTSEETGTKGRTEVKDETIEEKKVKVKYRKDRITELPPLAFSVGGQYRVTADTSLKGGPGEEYKSYEDLKPDQTVDINAKVVDKPWYTVIREGHIIGYVAAQSVELTGIPVDATAKKAKRDKNVAETEVTAGMSCKTLELQVDGKDGKTEAETVKGCQRADGVWTFS